MHGLVSNLDYAIIVWKSNVPTAIKACSFVDNCVSSDLFATEGNCLMKRAHLTNNTI